MIERFDGSDGLGAIYPPMVWSIVALRARLQGRLARVAVLPRAARWAVIEEGDTVRLQPCKSPVWDTAITLRALSAAGLSSQHDAVNRAHATGCWIGRYAQGDWAERDRRPARRLVL